MCKVAYVARRLLYDICDILTPVEDEYEECYRLLINWMSVCTNRFGRRIIPSLPAVKENHDELLNDMVELYSGILSVRNPKNTRPTLNALFTATYYMMVQYKHNVVLCSHISYYFQLITSQLNCWDSFPFNHENEV